MGESAKSLAEQNVIDGPLPDMMFRRLESDEEVESFRVWARENYDPKITKKTLIAYHPVVRDEWSKIATARGELIPA